MSYVIASLDTAFTTKSESDYSALTVWGVFSGSHNAPATSYIKRDINGESKMQRTDQQHQSDLFDSAAQVKFPDIPSSGGDIPRVMLMQAWAERLELHELVQKVAATCRKMRVDKLIIENKAAGHSVAQELRRLFGHEDWGVQLIDPKSQDKLARLYSVQHLFAEGMVYAPERHWADMVITQVGAFPKGKHDDLVDTVSQGIRHLRDMGLLTRAPEWAADVRDSMLHRGRYNLQPLYEI
jgi:predicted phage terminase large subunit-like protein